MKRVKKLILLALVIVIIFVSNKLIRSKNIIERLNAGWDLGLSTTDFLGTRVKYSAKNKSDWNGESSGFTVVDFENFNMMEIGRHFMKHLSLDDKEKIKFIESDLKVPEKYRLNFDELDEYVLKEKYYSQNGGKDMLEDPRKNQCHIFVKLVDSGARMYIVEALGSLNLDAEF